LRHWNRKMDDAVFYNLCHLVAQYYKCTIIIIDDLWDEEIEFCGGENGCYEITRVRLPEIGCRLWFFVTATSIICIPKNAGKLIGSICWGKMGFFNVDPNHVCKKCGQAVYWDEMGMTWEGAFPAAGQSCVNGEAHHWEWFNPMDHSSLDGVATLYPVNNHQYRVKVTTSSGTSGTVTPHFEEPDTIPAPGKDQEIDWLKAFKLNPRLLF